MAGLMDGLSLLLPAPDRETAPALMECVLPPTLQPAVKSDDSAPLGRQVVSALEKELFLGTLSASRPESQEGSRLV